MSTTGHEPAPLEPAPGSPANTVMLHIPDTGEWQAIGTTAEEWQAIGTVTDSDFAFARHVADMFEVPFGVAFGHWGLSPVWREAVLRQAAPHLAPLTPAFALGCGCAGVGVPLPGRVGIPVPELTALCGAHEAMAHAGARGSAAAGFPLQRPAAGPGGV